MTDGLSEAYDGRKWDAFSEANELRLENDQLKAENAKLREERDMYRDLVGCMVHPDISDQLQAEVAALRELVRDTLTTISWCTIDCYPSDNKKRELNARARELRIEVD